MHKKTREFLLKKKTVIILAVFLFFFLFSRLIIPSKAAIDYFYPSICLGSWENPDKAQGRPETLDQNSPQFDANNSAVFARGGNSSQSILCGGFVNNLPERTDVKKLSLRLIWSSMTKDSQDQLSPLAKKPLNAEISAYQADVIPEIKPVLPVAENINTGLTAATSDETVKPVISSSTEIATVKDSQEIKTEIETITAAPISDTGGLNQEERNLFVIRYTFDGNTWKTLRNIQSVNNQTDLELPVNSLYDLSNLRFSIESIGQKEGVYLDGMFLVAEHQDDSSLNASEDNTPNFNNSELAAIKSNNNYSLALLRNQSGNYLLWFYDRQDGNSWKRIDTSDGIKTDGPIALKDDYAFWLSDDGQALIGYNARTNSYFSQSIDLNDNQGLSFDIDNLVISYKNSRLLIHENFSGEEITSDDNSRLNEEMLARFQSEKQKNIEQNNKFFDVSLIDKNLIITVLEASSTDNVDLFKDSEAASGTPINTKEEGAAVASEENKQATAASNNPVESIVKEPVENTVENITPGETAQQIYRLPTIDDVTPAEIPLVETPSVVTPPAEIPLVITLPAETPPSVTLPAEKSTAETLPVSPTNNIDVIAD